VCIVYTLNDGGMTFFAHFSEVWMRKWTRWRVQTA
jgi:hypothetical protein